MCGIIGIVAKRPFTAAQLLERLRHLEYRGYDSFGYASPEAVRKDIGRIQIIEQDSAVLMTRGIAHTRWATHGGVTVPNAHPHAHGRVTLVHNGIIDNYEEIAAGNFLSETDTERIAAAIDGRLAGMPPLEAIEETLAAAKGIWALAIMIEGEEGIFAARNKVPLILGRNADALMLCSDIRGLRDATEVAMLDEGDLAHLQSGAVTIYRRGMTHEPLWEPNVVEAREEYGEGYAMEREIRQTPGILRRFPRVDLAPPALVVGCGSSRHAALIARHLAGSDAQVELASEPLPKARTVIAVSQSGETADVLDAVRALGGVRIVALVNTPHSTLTRLADETILLGAGEERCVAATKSFTAQVAALCAMLGTDCTQEALAGVHAAIDAWDETARLARTLADAEHLFILGRGAHYAVAMELALKLKEVPYQHAEAIPALELKHGPLALITDKTPVLVLGDPEDARLASTAHEVEARAGRVVRLLYGTSPAGIFRTIVAGQILAFELGRLRGTPIDMPRNLAKSVTVY